MRVRVLLIALVLALCAGGCTAFSDEAEPERREPRRAVSASAPDHRLTMIADADPVAAAATMSRTLFDRSPVVVVARDGDRAGLLLAASAAVGLGVPLLLEPKGDGAHDVLAEEIGRLGSGTVLAVGEADGRAADRATGASDGRAGHDVLAVPADAGAVAAATGLDFQPAEPVTSRNDPASVAALDPAAPVALRLPEAPASSSADADAARLPGVDRAEPLTGTVVLATGESASTAALATARAAGATVSLTSGEADPRRSEDALDALAEAAPEAVVAIGAGFAAEDGLDWKVETAVKGMQLPGGGQVLFPGRLLVALYGHPGTGALGVLGEQDLEGSIERARAHAAPYETLVEGPVVPAFEIIATVASTAPGADGDYSTEADVEQLRPWVEAAGEAGVYVVLDLQPGRTDFLTQAQRYQALLELPHVGLALDPEWRLSPNGVHLREVGSVGVDEVNRLIGWLADLTREHVLPQKLLVLHQFQLRMIDGRERLDTSRDELAVMVHADGQGSQGDKQATWRALHANPPAGLFWGWKNFYDEDKPMLTPEQTMADVSPRPDLISYQ
ncbi:hypothetical protein [Blastococcus mobilis]|uniref:Lipoprotein n=1 Tax=Blastococcus mobilis TaxID=1938746 RepID=A0A238ZWD7_9ACTN|nr:hypothetical protein [Blastococcus mobilis]SNR87650.1 hypothetical protein SAMN06272737_13430 [Blastococcus mobilis]